MNTTLATAGAMNRDDMTLSIIRLESQLLAANQAAEQRRQAIEHMSTAIQADAANHARHVHALREALHAALEALQRARSGEQKAHIYCAQALETVREALRYE